MTRMVKVSVIIPVYNAEKYLRQCLESLINQTLKEIEIICVNDGSTDHSLQILREYEMIDPRVIILTQKNQHAGAARNTGMDYAHGKYYVFLDADDFFERNLLEEQFYQCEKYKADIGLCAANIYDEQTGNLKDAPWLLKANLIKEQPFNRKNLKSNLWKVTMPNPWTKIFLSSFIHKFNLRFQTLLVANDVYFVLSALALADSIVAVNAPLVHYRVGLTNNLQSNNSLAPTSAFEALKACRRKLEQENIFGDMTVCFFNEAVEQCIYILKTTEYNSKIHQYVLYELQSHYLDELGLNGFDIDAYNKLMHQIYSKATKGRSSLPVRAIQCLQEHGWKYTIGRILKKEQ